jgi:CO/xanthine dehydrogenase Mo-binding subunit
LRRLDAESLRDRMLDFSGELELPDVVEATWKEGLKEDYRYESTVRFRTVYQPWFRNALPALATEFDVANPSSTTSQRVRSTVAPQALAIMNSPWVEARAKAAARQIDYEGRSGNSEITDLKSEAFRIERSFQLAFGRSPDEREIKWATRILEAKGLEELAHQLMASIEFRFIE